MKLWVTKIRAIDPKTGELKSYSGPEVPGISLSDAEEYLQNNGLGYCKVEGELVAEIPCKPGTYIPDWDSMRDYENEQFN